MGTHPTTRRSSLVLGITLVILAGLTTPAGAHPFGQQYYAHRLVVVGHADKLEFRYSCEIPGQEVMRRFALAYATADQVGEDEDKAFTDKTFAELGEGLFVLVDGWHMIVGSMLNSFGMFVI